MSDDFINLRPHNFPIAFADRTVGAALEMRIATAIQWINSNPVAYQRRGNVIASICRRIYASVMTSPAASIVMTRTTPMPVRVFPVSTPR